MTRLAWRVSSRIDLTSAFTDSVIKASFGIGTDLTNDFRKASDPSQKSKALNMVIKLNKINGKDCIKLSDDKGKVRFTMMYTIIVPDQPLYSILVRLKRLEKLNKSWALRRTRDNDNMKYFMVRVINQL